MALRFSISVKTSEDNYTGNQDGLEGIGLDSPRDPSLEEPEGTIADCHLVS